MAEDIDTLAIGALLRRYRCGEATPSALLEKLYQRIERHQSQGAAGIWITLLPRERVLELAASVQGRDPRSLALYGIPFAIKDNIDLAGAPTTAACPAFAYKAERSAHVVERLMAAGAVPIGKTNLDQFATGLTGTRSPYGVCRNSFNSEFISGGSSSGSAVAVALGMVSFALGSDTAGSGRVPAAFNNLIGLKPTCGRLSARGMLPACRSLDTVSILAPDADDAARVLRVAEGFDAADPFSRRRCPPARPLDLVCSRFRFGCPRSDQLEFFGNEDYSKLFERSAQILEQLGGQPIAIDFAPFRECAQLLYEGPWVAERYVVLESLLRMTPDAVHPVTRAIVERGKRFSAADAFRAQYRLRELQRYTEAIWDTIDMLVTPTCGTIYRIDEVLADPIRLNTQLGVYTNFVNLLDLAAIAVPAGFTRAGLPFGITLIGPAWTDFGLLAVASRFQREASSGGEGIGDSQPLQGDFEWNETSDRIAIAVCGAHLEGLALNHELRECGAVLSQRTRTAACYRLYALPGGPPERPGLVRVQEQGASIEVEVWLLPQSAVGSFIARIPSPLAIGKVRLIDGSDVCGFTCEAYAANGARDITRFGGWRAYLGSEANIP
jgi:allophanate hydrolase